MNYQASITDGDFEEIKAAQAVNEKCIKLGIELKNPNLPEVVDDDNNLVIKKENVFWTVLFSSIKKCKNYESKVSVKSQYKKLV